MNDKLSANSAASAAVERRGQHTEQVQVHGRYDVVCVGAGGKIKWTDSADNLVTTVGKNDLLDKYFKGSSYTQTIRMGLCGAGTKAVGDTQASHGGWSEVGLANAPTYTGSRKTITMNAASAASSSTPSQAFAITSSGTVAGCFMNNGGSGTIDDTTGILYSAGDFTGGSKTVANGDTLNVTYTATV